jgi:hypothetical protein
MPRPHVAPGKHFWKELIMQQVALIRTAAAALTISVLAGCESSGLSVREPRGKDYSTYVFSMYGDEGAKSPAATARGAQAAAPDGISMLGGSAASQTAARRPLITPVNVVVAQLGEVAPPLKMIQRLRSDSGAFASVQPISGLVDAQPVADPSARPQDFSTQQDARTHGERMRRLAGDLGADYLFLYGGTVDRSTTDTPLKLANATIVGAFLIPSEKIEATARAAGSLIDVRSGRVVVSVSADGHRDMLTPSVAREGDEIKLLEALREEVISKLGDQLAERLDVKSSHAAGGEPHQ